MSATLMLYPLALFCFNSALSYKDLCISLTTWQLLQNIYSTMAQIQEASTSAAATTTTLPSQEEVNLESLWEESKHFSYAFHTLYANIVLYSLPLKRSHFYGAVASPHI
jgi:hypothetical protein